MLKNVSLAKRNFVFPRGHVISSIYQPGLVLSCQDSASLIPLKTLAFETPLTSSSRISNIFLVGGMDIFRDFTLPLSYLSSLGYVQPTDLPEWLLGALQYYPHLPSLHLGHKIINASTDICKVHTLYNKRNSHKN